MAHRRLAFVGLLVSTLAVIGPSLRGDYDPLDVDDEAAVETVDLVVNDQARNREIPLRVYLPAPAEPAAVVMFSHGLGGSKNNNPYLGEHWSRRGYVVVSMQHQGSDETVWRDVEPAQRFAAMKRAANLRNATLRFDDVPAVIDQLEQWNKDAESPLHDRLDLSRLGMSGHSFGAMTTQAVSGQRRGWGPDQADDRIRAAVMMSPSSPRRGEPAKAFGGVNIPWLLMTGTHDTSPIGDADVASRLAVYPALPEGNKYQVVLNDAEHSAFGDRPLPGDRRDRNPNHHRVTLALSTAFWDAHLKHDQAALAWLKGDGPREVMEPEDRWEHK